MQYRRRRRGESYYHPVDEPRESWVTWPRLLKTSNKLAPPKRARPGRTIYTWPRICPIDGTPLGVDVALKARDIRKITLAHVPPPKGVDPDDYVQEIFLAITRRNKLAGAYDPRRGSFSHYIVMIARSVRSHIREREGRWARHELTPAEELDRYRDEAEPIEEFEDDNERAYEFVTSPPPLLFTVRDRDTMGMVPRETRPDLQRLRPSAEARDRKSRPGQAHLDHEGGSSQRPTA